MLSTTPPRPWLALLGGLLAAAVALALLVELQREPPQRQAVAPLPPPPAQPSPFGAGPAVAGPDLAPPDAPAPGRAEPAAVVPAGLTPDEWQQLREDLANHPQREAELARISQLMLFHKRVQQFRELRSAGTATGPLRALAQAIDAEMHTHLQNNELSAGEARLLKAALLEVLQPDALQRQAALAQWAAGESALVAAQHQDDAREVQYKQKEAELLAAWQARPAAQRDPRELETQLEALRRQVFPEPR
jgi:hypothetical protein